MNSNDTLEYDDDDFFFEDEDSDLIFSATQNQQNKDFSGCSVRQFNLGYDIILSDYVGSLGFEEITDCNNNILFDKKYGYTEFTKQCFWLNDKFINENIYKS